VATPTIITDGTTLVEWLSGNYSHPYLTCTCLPQSLGGTLNRRTGCHNIINQYMRNIIVNCLTVAKCGCGLSSTHGRRRVPLHGVGDACEWLHHPQPASSGKPARNQ